MADPIGFLIPAFRINSMPALLKLASFFPSVSPGRTCGPARIWKTNAFEGVYLAGTEAIEAARVMLLSPLPRHNRAARLFLKEARLEAAPPRVIYCSFHLKGLHLCKVDSGHNIQHGTVPLTATDWPGSSGAALPASSMPALPVGNAHSAS